MDLFEKPERNHAIPTLQLAPVIDVFIIIILFFIMGSFTSGVSIEIPSGLKLPWSLLEERSEFGPEVQIYKNEVHFKFIKSSNLVSEIGSTSMTWFENQMKIREFVAGMSSTKGPKSVNLVISEEVPYSVVYDLSQHLRAAGFEDLSYITERERGAGK